MAKAPAKADSATPAPAPTNPAPSPWASGDSDKNDPVTQAQTTPTGPSPKQVDAAAEALTPNASTNRIDAEAKDQVTPVGVDVSSVQHQLRKAFDELTEEDRAELTAAVEEFATKELKKLKRRKSAREMEAAFVDGNKVRAQLRASAVTEAEAEDE